MKPQIKVGDFVRVKPGVDKGKYADKLGWNPNMDSMVGNIYPVAHIGQKDNNIHLEVPWEGWPYVFWLDDVELVGRAGEGHPSHQAERKQQDRCPKCGGVADGVCKCEPEMRMEFEGADRPRHPGEVLRDLMGEKGWSIYHLEGKAIAPFGYHFSARYWQGVLDSKEDLQPSSGAVALARAFNTPVSFWINLQNNYDAWCLQNEAQGER